MGANRYRVIDTDGSEVGSIDDERPHLSEEEAVTLPDGSLAAIVEVYDDEDGREGDVVATLVVDVSERPSSHLPHPASGTDPGVRAAPSARVSIRGVSAVRASAPPTMRTADPLQTAAASMRCPQRRLRQCRPLFTTGS